MKPPHRAPLRARATGGADEPPPTRTQLGLLAIGLHVTSLVIGAVERWPTGRRGGGPGSRRV